MQLLIRQLNITHSQIIAIPLRSKLSLRRDWVLEGCLCGLLGGDTSQLTIGRKLSRAVKNRWVQIAILLLIAGCTRQSETVMDKSICENKYRTKMSKKLMSYGFSVNENVFQRTAIARKTVTSNLTTTQTSVVFEWDFADLVTFCNVYSSHTGPWSTAHGPTARVCRPCPTHSRLSSTKAIFKLNYLGHTLFWLLKVNL